VYAGVQAHPDYLSYFNVLAGPTPEDVLVDSDFDWGQDLPRLSAELRRRGITDVAISYHGSADLSRHDMPQMRPLSPYEPSSGWVAISAYNRKLLALVRQQKDAQPRPAFAWLEDYRPVTTVGKTIRIYRIPDVRAAHGSTAKSTADR
jgi:hypothetical protein